MSDDMRNEVSDSSSSATSVQETPSTSGSFSSSRKSRAVLFWITLISLSSAGSILGVRLATPLTIDDKAIAVLVFYVLPAVTILILAALRRVLGIAAALVLPFPWLAIFMGTSDSILLWFVPVLTCLLLIVVIRMSAGHRLLPAASLVTVALVLLMILLPGPRQPAEGTGVLLVGIDGAKWERIDALISEGKLPNLAGLLEDGHRASLESLPSMYSPQVWTSIATGCPPEMHGIDDFRNLQSELRVGRIWDQLEKEGRSYGLVGWLSTWPPSPALGEHDFVIPSNLAPDAESFPGEYSFFRKVRDLADPTAENEISYVQAALSCLRHGMRLSSMKDAAIEVIMRRLQRRTYLDQFWRVRKLQFAFQGDLFAELVRTRRPEFAAVLFRQVDNVSHIFWKYDEPEGFDEVTDQDLARYGMVIDEMYVEADRNLGKILQVAPGTADFVIVSDHGFQSANQASRIAMFCRIRTENLISALGLSDEVFGSNLDYKVYLRPLVSEEESREKLLDEMEDVLASAHLLGDPNPLFEVQRERRMICLFIAERRSSIWSCPIVLDGVEHPFDELMSTSGKSKISGVHHPEGIYLLAGPSAADAIPSDSLNVLDVAPTLATLLDLPTSPLWVGRPALRHSGSSEREVREYPLPAGPVRTASGVDEALKEKLRAIGYLE
jgi:hypothetical protein